MPGPTKSAPLEAGSAEAGTIPSAATAQQVPTPQRALRDEAPRAQAGPGMRAGHGSPAATFAPPDADLEFGRLHADPVPLVAAWDRFASFWATGITIVGLVITFVMFAVACPEWAHYVAQFYYTAWDSAADYADAFTGRYTISWLSLPHALIAAGTHTGVLAAAMAGFSQVFKLEYGAWSGLVIAAGSAFLKLTAGIFATQRFGKRWFSFILPVALAIVYTPVAHVTMFHFVAYMTSISYILQAVLLMQAASGKGLKFLAKAFKGMIPTLVEKGNAEQEKIAADIKAPLYPKLEEYKQWHKDLLQEHKRQQREEADLKSRGAELARGEAALQVKKDRWCAAYFKRTEVLRNLTAAASALRTRITAAMETEVAISGRNEEAAGMLAAREAILTTLDTGITAALSTYQSQVLAPGHQVAAASNLHASIQQLLHAAQVSAPQQ